MLPKIEINSEQASHDDANIRDKEFGVFLLDFHRNFFTKKSLGSRKRCLSPASQRTSAWVSW